jgi:hypothetical protein
VTQPIDITPAKGKLGLLLVGLGAVSTTTIAGVMAIRKGLAQPIGSLTQMGTIRLGKRTEARAPKINEFLPLAGLDDIVFGGWDIFEEDCYAAARVAGVLENSQLDQVRAELEAGSTVRTSRRGRTSGIWPSSSSPTSAPSSPGTVATGSSWCGPAAPKSS